MSLTPLQLRIAIAMGLAGCVATEDAPPLEEGSLSTAEQGLSLGSSLGNSVAVSGTCGQANAVTPTCASSTASDRTYEWTAPSTGTFTFTTTGPQTNYNSVLQIANHAPPYAALACNDDANPSTTKSTVALSLAASTKVLVQVDGYASLCGNFQLGITKNCTSACNTPPPCRAPVGTCTVYGVCSYENLCDASEVCHLGECVPKCTIDPRFPC
ncbi:MAG: hypothetical protein R3B48_03270 [Kofleriaceae bacterium]